MRDTSHYVAGIGAGMSHDGQEATINFMQNNGEEVKVAFHAAAATSILLNIEQAIGKIFEMQRASLGGVDPRTFYAIGPRKVKAVQGAIAQGVPILSFVLESNVRLDLPLDRTLCREIAEWLSGLADHPEGSTPLRN